ncbi:restriction endonuclease subunit S [Psychroflexus maritimus]|uniref:Restriction endonuclease subunit S n=1 Tax=Psychroflexus maritimus TaxID=2714865 RepID=A0A967E3I5_9FLAO|nr:restriction endonuclease subunit S [Psychroflexus maritimus]NGZ90739.1 restriction endonuclease subunit S [Psychroflexus maritimus]
MKVKKILLKKAINFNPKESLIKGDLHKKIPMGNLKEFQKKINGFEIEEFKAGPKFRNEDVLVAKITPCLENGKTAYVDILNEGEVAFGSSEFIVLRSTKLTDPHYVYYLSISPTFRKRAISCMEGTSGRQRVNENTLKNFELPFPDVNYQKQIAKVLSDLDAKIEVNNQINAKLEAMAKSLYEYWFVQFDFPSPPTPEGGAIQGKPYKSSGGKMVYNDELKREIPEGWEVKSLGDVLDFQRGISYRSSEIKDKEGVPLINLNSFNLDGRYKNKGLKKYSGKYNKSKIVKANDLIIAITDVTRNADIIGKSFFVPEIFDDRDLLISCDTAKVEVNNQDLLYFLNFFFNSKPYHEYIKHFASGTLVLHLNLKGVEWCKIALPDDKLLFQFTNKIKPILKRIDNTILENQKLADLRDWLLPMLMNGQVSVGDAMEYQSSGDSELGVVAED